MAGLEKSIWAKASSGRSHQYDARSISLPPPETFMTPPKRTPSPIKAGTSKGMTNGISTAATGSRQLLTPPHAFHRFEQACQRLRWKFMDLQSSYRRATAPEEFGFTRADAERNFKVDFHEFYVWIEQAVVLLLLIFGVTVSRSGGGGGGGGSASHAYHHNVLKALEDETSPLYEALGRGDVNQALWKAKELRNRWKDAAEGRETPPLQMYDLTWIVTTVLGGLETAYGVAAVEVTAVREAEMASGVNGNGTGGDGDGDDEEWEWMVEPMDWEAA